MKIKIKKLKDILNVFISSLFFNSQTKTLPCSSPAAINLEEELKQAVLIGPIPWPNKIYMSHDDVMYG